MNLQAIEQTGNIVADNAYELLLTQYDQ